MRKSLYFPVVLLMLAPLAASAGVNKCVKGEHIIYSDKVCPDGYQDAKIKANMTDYNGKEARKRNTEFIAASSRPRVGSLRPSASASGSSTTQIGGGSKQSTYGATVANVRRVERAVGH